MVSPLPKAIIDATPRGQYPACMITQVTPLLVSFDGGVTSVPGDKIAGATYALATAGNNARALMDSPNKPLIFPIG